jgi:hypothetical protein
VTETTIDYPAESSAIPSSAGGSINILEEECSDFRLIQALSRQLTHCRQAMPWSDVAIVRNGALQVTHPLRSSVATGTFSVGC